MREGPRGAWDSEFEGRPREQQGQQVGWGRSRGSEGAGDLQRG